MTRDVTDPAVNDDKTTPVNADKLMIIDTETNPDSLKEITLTNLKVFLKTYNDSLYRNWIEVTDTWTYASASTITIPTDGTTTYRVGMKIRLKQGAGYKYYYGHTVAATLLTVAVNTDYVVANAAITDVAYSFASTPYGFPSEFNFAAAPTNLTQTSGTLTAKYSLIGHYLAIRFHFVFGASSAIAGSVTMATPFVIGTYAGSTVRAPVGTVTYLDASPAGTYLGNVVVNAADTLLLQVITASGTYATVGAISSTIPFTWTTSDEMDFFALVPLA